MLSRVCEINARSSGRKLGYCLAGAAMLIPVSALAAQTPGPLVDVGWVKAHIGKPGIVFLDVRGKLAGKSKADYLRGHVPGAVWTNYLKDGWRSKDKAGVPGQMSPVPKLEKLIGGLGIDNKTLVVILPGGGKALDMGTGTRIYWTFKVLGHDNVTLLNGGMKAYLKEKNKAKKPVNPLQKGAVKPVAKKFVASLRKDMIVSKDDVKKVSSSGSMPLIDNRPNNQFLGVNRHRLAKRNGTIPGAKNIPENWMTMNGGGMFRNKIQLAQLYKAAGVPTKGKQINFCNTGHWASLGWFVSHEIMGNKNVKMYDGSMLEWSADKSLPIEQRVKLN